MKKKKKRKSTLKGSTAKCRFAKKRTNKRQKKLCNLKIKTKNVFLFLQKNGFLILIGNSRVGKN